MVAPPAHLLALLEARGIRVTSQRLRIARVLLTRPQHLCAEQLPRQVRQDGGSISRATVYNNLKLFVARGLLRELRVGSRKLFYDSNTYLHHHIYDEDTGTVIDVDAECISVSVAPGTLPPDTLQTGTEVLLRVRRCRAP